MRILKLEAANVKRLKAVEITPEGDVVVIGGKNTAGKSSVLDAIFYALGGKDSQPARPVRKGEKKASIRLELGDKKKVEYVVKRSITAKGGGQLVVETSEGEKQQSPQGILDALVGAISFDPSGFARMKGREQAETLKALVGKDFSKHETERKAIYEERTVVARQAKNAASVAEDMDEIPDAPEKPVDMEGLGKELERRVEQRSENERKQERLNKATDNARDAERETKRAQDELEAARRKVIDAEQRLEHAQEAQREAIATAEKLAGEADEIEDPNVAEITAKIAKVKDLNFAFETNKKRREKMDEAEMFQAKVDKLTARIEEIDAQKRRMIEQADLPVEGLGFDEDGVTFGDVPFEQASQSERWRTSIAIGAAMNPSLRVMLVREGALLDDDSLKTVAEMAADRDLQLWIEDVGEERSSVVIEDGAIKA